MKLLARSGFWSVCLAVVSIVQAPAGAADTADVDVSAVQRAIAKKQMPLLTRDKVVFALKYDGTAKPTVLGDFSGWKPTAMQKQGKDLWLASIPKPERAYLEYKFRLDSEWLADPANSRTITNAGRTNSFFTTPGYRGEPPVTGDYAKQPGKLDQWEMDSAALKSKRKVGVWMPESYAASNTTRYRVVYLHDGPEYWGLVRAGELANRLNLSGRVVPFIVVLVPPVNRMAEYWKDDTAYKRFFATELVPEIDKRYRTIAKPEARVVGGASLGGLVSLRIGLDYPTVFGNVLSQSGSFWADNRDMESTLRRKEPLPLRIWLDWGTFEQELTEANDRLHPLMQERGWTVRGERRATVHNWTSWRDRFCEGVTWLLSRTPQERPYSAWDCFSPKGQHRWPD